jgi:hypothetical protein
MPWFRGAASKAILSTLPGPRLKKLYLPQAGEARAAGLGDDWAQFKSTRRLRSPITTERFAPFQPAAITDGQSRVEAEAQAH